MRRIDTHGALIFSKYDLPVCISYPGVAFGFWIFHFSEFDFGFACSLSLRLSTSRVRRASSESAWGRGPDVAVKKLLAMVNTIGTKDTGSEERKSHLLARLKSATVYHSLPTFHLHKTRRWGRPGRRDLT
jgi:hypothetical protein